MKLALPNLFTPLYLKLSEDTPWPAHEKAFYLLTKNGPFFCRNHALFRSSVPTEKLPAELAAHEPFVELNCPKVPQRLLERIIGFFDLIAQRHGAEAAALLVWNTKTQGIEAIIPPQISVVSSSWNGFPLEVHYEVPPLAPHLMLVGDIHCHVDGPAFASHTDKTDETHRPGLHVVVGRIYQEPPEFHLETVVDGTRFQIKNLFSIAQGYARRRRHEVPQAWIDQVRITSWASYRQSSCARTEASLEDAERQRLDHWLKEHGRDSGAEQGQGNGASAADNNTWLGRREANPEDTK